MSRDVIDLILGDACFVVVVNRNAAITSLRHVVTTGPEYNEAEFRKWYYSQYYEIPGDEFHFCKSREERDKLLDSLKNEGPVRSG